MRAFKKYFIALFITAALFGIAFFASKYFNDQKINEIKEVQNQVTVDIISSETQFDLLQELSCQDQDSDYLSGEISNLADKITYAEQNLSDQKELTLLKQQYAIVEVKDFLLTKRISERCKQDTVTILYFYKNANVCTDCVRQGYVLDTLHKKYPGIRVYSFDTGLDSSTVRALISIYKVSDQQPSLVIDGKTENKFMAVEDIEKLLPTSLTMPDSKAVKAVPGKKASAK
jgi:hypothetical protein